jgi:hypothetical protein
MFAEEMHPEYIKKLYTEFMKKIILLPFLMLFFISCSTEETGFNDAEAVVMNTGADTDNEEVKPLYAQCVFDVVGNVAIDASNGIDNPIIVFSGNFGQAITNLKMYSVKLEIQKIADCEDFYSDFDPVITFKYEAPIRVPQTVQPEFHFNRTQLPFECYKWRIVIEGGNPDFTLLPYCFSASQWYESPLF